MAPLLHRLPFKAIYLLYFFVVMLFIQLPCWLIYYSWRPNRPRRSWTLHRTICARILRKLTQLPTAVGILTNRDLSLEVPQKDLRRYNSRFVWIPELEDEDIVGMVRECAVKAGVKSIAIPAYWILKQGIKWSPAYERARKDEKVILYFHGGAFMVRSLSPPYLVLVLTFVSDGNRTPISSNLDCSQGNPQIFCVSLPIVIGRLPAQFRPSSGTEEPIPGRSPRCNRGVQLSCLRGRIPG